MYNAYNRFPRYITAAERRSDAGKRMAKLRKQGYDLQPIDAFRGNKIAKSFWGHSWCRHLESYSDYSNRLPRGRTYVRNGSVCHLEIKSGEINAIVSGSELYEIKIKIDPISAKKWAGLKKQCSGKIASLLALLQGKLSDEIMEVVTHKDQGLFPTPKEIHLDCNCPDWADLCKHLAAVLYGVGVRLDNQPDLLFLLRGIDHKELIETDIGETLNKSQPSKGRRIASTDLSTVFGIDIETEPSAAKKPSSAKRSTPRQRTPPNAKKKPQKAAKKKARKKPIALRSPKTGTDIRKLRRKFGMTEWEFAFIIDVSAATVKNWESKGKSPHNARNKNQQKLDTIAPLTKTIAWDRLNEYI